MVKNMSLKVPLNVGSIKLPDYLVDPTTRTVTAVRVEEPNGVVYLEFVNSKTWEESARRLLRRFGNSMIYTPWEVKDFFRSAYELDVRGDSGSYRVTILKRFLEHLPKGKTVLV